MTVHSSPMMDTLADKKIEVSNGGRNDDNAAKKICGFLSGKTCRSLCIGQILALMLSGVCIFTGLLRQVGYSLSLSQNLGHYSLVLLISIFLPLCRTARGNANREKIDSSEAKVTLVSKYKTLSFVAVAVIDPHATWAILEAYTYTTVSSVQLLNCISLPVVMVCSFFLLHHRYSWNHYLSATLSIAGSIMMVLTDSLLPEHSSSPYQNVTNVSQNLHISQQKTPAYMHKLFGDFLALFGAALLGVSNVLQEGLIIHYGRTSYLLNVSLAGVCISFFYLLIFELLSFVELVNYGSIASVAIPSSTVWYYLGYVGSQFLMYLTMASTIHSVNALFLNLSFVTADFYALIAGMVIFHNRMHYLYFISFVVIILGILLYFVKKPNVKTYGKATEMEVEQHG